MSSLEYCLQEARKIPLTKGKQRVYSCITDKRGRLIAESQNLYEKSHPLQRKYSVKAGMSEERCYLHSEVASIIKAAKRNPLNCTLYVARIGKSGRALDSIPCPSCRIAIKECGFISSVQYCVGE